MSAQTFIPTLRRVHAPNQLGIHDREFQRRLIVEIRCGGDERAIIIVVRQQQQEQQQQWSRHRHALVVGRHGRTRGAVGVYGGCMTVRIVLAQNPAVVSRRSQYVASAPARSLANAFNAAAW
jgi:hypothetical protein